MLQMMCPELHRRAVSADLRRPYELGLVLDREKHRLVLSRRSVKLLPGASQRPSVRLGSGELAALAMGCLDVREAREQGQVDIPNRTAGDVLQALFPLCPMWQPPFDW